jgi:hypothetical protein
LWGGSGSHGIRAELYGAFLGTIGEDHLCILGIRSFMYREQTKVVCVGLLSDLLHFVSLDILDKDYVLFAIVEPAYQDKFIESFGLFDLGHRSYNGERIPLPELLITVRFKSHRNVIRRLSHPATNP